MISLTDSAAIKIKELSQDEMKSYLRISIEGGGCSGFQYKYEFVPNHDASDLLITNQEATVVIDPVSADLMKDSVIDYIETLGSSEFSIKNPNSVSRCGCGNSFSV